MTPSQGSILRWSWKFHRNAFIKSSRFEGWRFMQKRESRNEPLYSFFNKLKTFAKLLTEVPPNIFGGLTHEFGFIIIYRISFCNT